MRLDKEQYLALCETEVDKEIARHYLRLRNDLPEGQRDSFLFTALFCSH